MRARKMKEPRSFRLPAPPPSALRLLHGAHPHNIRLQCNLERHFVTVNRVFHVNSNIRQTAEKLYDSGLRIQLASSVRP